MVDPQARLDTDWRELRRERHITITALAAAMGTPVWTIYGYSRGARQPTIKWQLRALLTIELLSARAEEAS